MPEKDNGLSGLPPSLSYDEVPQPPRWSGIRRPNGVPYCTLLSCDEESLMQSPDSHLHSTVSRPPLTPVVPELPPHPAVSPEITKYPPETSGVNIGRREN